MCLPCPPLQLPHTPNVQPHKLSQAGGPEDDCPRCGAMVSRALRTTAGGEGSMEGPWDRLSCQGSLPGALEPGGLGGRPSLGPVPRCGSCCGQAHRGLGRGGFLGRAVPREGGPSPWQPTHSGDLGRRPWSWWGAHHAGLWMVTDVAFSSYPLSPPRLPAGTQCSHRPQAWPEGCTCPNTLNVWVGNLRPRGTQPIHPQSRPRTCCPAVWPRALPGVERPVN